MLTTTCNPSTWKTEQEDQELQASRGYIPRHYGAWEERREMKDRGEEGEKEGREKGRGRVWWEVFRYDGCVLKDLKAWGCLIMNC